MEQLADWIEHYNVWDLVLSVSVLVVIFIIRIALLWSLRKAGIHQKALKSLLNWVTFYAILLFFLFYYSDSAWIQSEWIKFGKIHITPSLIIIAVLIVSLAYRLSKLLTEALLPSLYSRYSVNKGLQYTLSRMVHYVIMVTAFLMSLSTVGINLSALTVFAGLISVGIGFGLQNIASNFISGIILLFERQIEVGDRIIINDIIGDVQQIKMRATIVKTLTNEHIIVPNSYFLEEQVVNRSYSDSRLKMVIPFGVAYGTDVEALRKLLEDLVREESEKRVSVLTKPAPYVNFIEFGDSSLNFELFVWISNPYDYVMLRSEFYYKIYHLLNEHNIEIPFPQRDVNIKNGYSEQESS
ncbi:mechanosensitive ion channel family protein [Bacillus sp. 2205SS5-2]|uniref:mechanosensitive ion channel family protein n=1 Tax=Bacillus sp. 2205SS5-2 TaxID=3109031 RepID=UPI003003CF36